MAAELRDCWLEIDGREPIELPGSEGMLVVSVSGDGIQVDEAERQCKDGSRCNSL